METDEIVHLDRATILAHLEREYTAIRARLDRLTEAEANQPGMLGYWSARDLLAHLVYWNRFPVDELKAAQYNEAFTHPEGNSDMINAAAVKAARGIPWSVLLAEFEQTYQVIRQVLLDLPDEEFTPQGSLHARLGDSIAGAFGNNTWEHYAPHREQLDEWMRGEDLLP